MAKTVKKLGDKLKKVNESMTLHFYDNGYMVEVSGRNKNDDYTNAKILCNTLAEVVELINEADVMERDS